MSRPSAYGHDRTVGLEQNHALRAARNRERASREQRTKVGYVLAQIPRRETERFDRQSNFRNIGSHDRGSPVLRIVPPLGIDHHGLRVCSREVHQPLTEPTSQDTLAIVGDQEAIDGRELSLRPLEQSRLGIACYVVPRLSVDPEDLLRPAKDACLRGCWPDCGGNQIRIDVTLGELVSEDICLRIRPDHRTQRCLTTKCGYIGGRICRPTSNVRTVCQLDDRDRRLRGDALHVTPNIFIEHHIADDEDGRGGELLQDSRHL